MWKLALTFAALAVLTLLSLAVSPAARARRQRILLLAACFALVAMVVGRFFVQPARSPVDISDFRPVEVSGDGDPYVGSTACVDCHPDQHASWRSSWHRTMTQVASIEAVIGNFDDVKTSAYGNEIQLFRDEDGQHWARMFDPEQPIHGDREQIERPIALTTGSHHMQVYWYATGMDRRLAQLPVVWLKETESWVPIHSIFIRPTQQKLGKTEARWNNTCIKCHTTQGRPRIEVASTPSVDSHVAEFGIACEACHGPGAKHVAFHRVVGDGDSAALTDEYEMAHPGRLDHRRASEVCGQCHGVWTSRDQSEANRQVAGGFTYRPGDVLSDTRHVFSSGQPDNDFVKRYLEKDPHFMQDRFWDDGMVRVSGREYNGLVRSPCFKRGTMSCMSCHELHPDAADSEWADDQLRPEAKSNTACIACHEQFSSEEQLTAHTHHEVSSTGSLCYNCHMPHTTYGLLKAIRSHEISSPTVQETLEVGRSNACNQCHIDRTLEWTATNLNSWYGMDPPANLPDVQERFSSTLVGALSGDAGQRALAAWSMGWTTAKEASRSDWTTPILAQLLNDPYHAVRFVARRSLRSNPAFADFEFDFLGDDAYRLARSGEVLEQWVESSTTRDPNPSLLISDSGQVLANEFRQLLESRDNRTVVLSE